MKPVNTESFWKQRIDDAKNSGNIRHSVFKAPEPEWAKITQDHKDILENIVSVQNSVLDAGCGYGRLFEVLGECKRYVGVDQSQEFIDLANKYYPNQEFYKYDLRSLPFNSNEFDWVVCCSVMIMVVNNLGWGDWEDIQNELLRVSRFGIICLEYGVTDTKTSSDTFYIVGKKQ